MRFLIDGHNLIGHSPGLRLDDPHDEQKLLERLHVFAQRRRHQIAVVFDPGLYYVPQQASPYTDVQVVWCRPGKSADEEILRRLAKATHPRDITVVTSDASLAGRARRTGANVISAEQFVQMMQAPALGQPAGEEEKPAPSLTPEEIEEWQALFARRRRPRRTP